ncbi:MAG: 4-hydroxy-tetrahydrodipicolinate reductase [Clostridia bacterium]|nr:4-hydroxy-tetrahydrodipicolinate reductase [Clostridia bacterium]
MEKQIKAIVWGYSGHMGTIVSNLIKNNHRFEYLGGIDKDDYNFSYTNADVIIDFSSPEGTMKMLDFAVKNKLPAVIATTGLNDEQENKIINASKNIPIFKSANMSFEVALVKNVLKNLASKLEDNDIEILETHHNRKTDAPSGTAKLLADAINSGLTKPRSIIYGREGKRDKEEIGIASLRGGNIVGEHSVKFFNDYETLEITHIAHSRELFASGALKAASFIINQKPGLYNMDDLFN